MSQGRDPIDLSAIIHELGSFGRYQRVIYVLVCLPVMFSALYNANYVFVAGIINYRCQVPQCENRPPEYQPGSWASFALPPDAKDQKCYKMESTKFECTPDAFVNKTVKCDSWVYETDETIVEAYDLGCQEWKRTLVGSINSAGIFLALPYTSYLSDTYGRKVAFIVTAFCNGLVGLIRSWSVNYYMHIVLEFFNSVLGSGVYSTGYILALEMVGVSHRVLGGNLLSSVFAIGQVLLGLVAWANPHWRSLLRILCIPSLFFLLYYFVIDESVRWLIVRQKKKQVIKIINKAARFNKVTFSDRIQKMLDAYESNNARQSIEEKADFDKQNSIVQVMKSVKLMVRVMICSFWWITVTFVYYGLSINAVSLAGNKYLNYVFMSLMELPGYLLSYLVLDVIGRKRTLMIAFFICGVGLLTIPWIPSTLPGLFTAVILLSKMMISGAFSAIYVYTVELFPTCARHRLLGACSMFGRIGNMMAPLTPMLMQYWESLPFLLFGLFSFTASALMLLTPETLNKALPDTIEQAENIDLQLKDPHFIDKGPKMLRRLSMGKSPKTETRDKNTSAGSTGQQGTK